MLHAALTALLALQAASGSPNVAPPSPAPGGYSSTPPSSSAPPSSNAPAPSAAPPAASESQSAAPPSPAATPTPGPRRGTTPGPKTSGDSLLVVNKSDSSVSILDPATGRLRATATVEPGAHEVEMIGDGLVAAVASYGSRTEPGRMVSLIEVATGKVVSRIDIGEGSRPHGLKALKDGRLLVTAEGKRELVVVDPRAAKVLARYPTGHDLSHMVTASPDGRVAYVTSLAGGWLTAIELSSGKILKDIPTGKGAEGLDASPDGREVWVANREANTISVIDVKLLAPVFTIQAAEFPIRVKLTPDGRHAVVTFTGSGDVRVFDTATRVEKAKIPLGRDAVAATEGRVFQKRFGTSPAPIGLLIAPDGKRAFVSASHADVVSVIDLDRLRVEDAWTTGREPDGLAAHFGLKPPPTPPPVTPQRRPTVTRRPGMGPS